MVVTLTITVFVIACPDALGLARADGGHDRTGRDAQNGILIKKAFAADVFYPLTISPELAVIAMMGSSLIVAANALLLKRTAIEGLE